VCYIGSIKDDVTDLNDLAVSLLKDLIAYAPSSVCERFHIPDSSLRGIELLDAACKGRGWLLKGNQYDYDRASRIILDEFRSGKMGRITLERPVETEALG
jgi:ribosome biogenesis GTPase A